MKRRGFTLVEALVTLLLLAVTLGVSVSYSRTSGHAASVRASAEQLAQVFRTARDRAMATGEPVAVVFPSENGSTPLSQGYYLLRGEERAQVAERHDLGRDNPHLSIFVGGWGAADARTLKLGLGSDAFRFDRFQLPNPKDYAFVFTPAGALRTNGLPHAGGVYQVVVSQGVRHQKTAYPAPDDLDVVPSHFELLAACRPYTISLSPLGQVSMREGAEGIEVTTEPLGYSAPALPAGSAPAGAAPSIVNVSVLPDMRNVVRPPGIESLVPKDGYISVTVNATSPEGWVLYCRWRDVTRGRTPGAVSSNMLERMRWDPESKVWTSTVYWRPPPDAKESWDYRLSCEVEDEHGRKAPAGLGAAIDLEVRERKLRLAYFNDMVPGVPITVVDEDSTRIRKVSHPLPDQFDRMPSWSPDGTQLAFIRFDGATGQLVMVGADGTGERVLVPSGLWIRNPCGWSPTGTRIAYLANTGICDVCICDADGQNRRNLTNTPEMEGTPTGVRGSPPLQWTPDEKYILATRATSSNMAVIKVHTDGSGSTDLYNVPGKSAGMPVLSPDGSFVVFRVMDPMGSGPIPQLWRINIDGTGLKKLAGDVEPQTYLFSSISPGGKVYYQGQILGQGRGLCEVAADGNSPPRLVLDEPGIQEASRLDCLDDSRVSLYIRAPDAPGTYVVDSATGIPRLVSNEPMESFPGGWSR